MAKLRVRAILWNHTPGQPGVPQVPIIRVRLDASKSESCYLRSVLLPIVRGVTLVDAAVNMRKSILSMRNLGQLAVAP